MSSEADRDAERLNEEMIADTSLSIRIYEDGEAVGVVNIDRQIADYHGASERVSRTLDRMQEEGLTFRGPVPEEEQPENEYRTMTTKSERSGEELGWFLLREIERVADNGLNTSGEPIGFAPKSE